MRDTYRVIPIWSTTTQEQFESYIEAIESKGYTFEYVHGSKGNIHCIRYWNPNGYTHRVI